MPYIEASFFEERFSDETFSKDMVAALTSAVTSVLGEEIGSETSVVLHGVPRERWGHGGRTMTKE
ncbi:tautomerase family protein [Gordonia paraffinivorans]|uniref:tautomerase family protein n=1 Tax=Gordonia paraffinivorans TaxID=175628 RepID=UPI001E2B8389|nr:tautomerase family protein [Gordonia paraffinivorans]MCD2147393.1 tautomerase family protein [Gordonia paraffinivorans]